MQDILSIFALIGACYAVYRFYKWQETLPQNNNKDDLYFKNVCEGVHALEEMVTQLEALEEIITDIESCDDRHLKCVRLIVPSTLGRDNELSMLVDGSDLTSKQLITLTYSERQKKRERLRSGIEQLYQNGIITHYYNIPKDQEADEENEETECL